MKGSTGILDSLVDKGHQRWRFAVDRGGTFTDVFAIDPQGRVYLEKLLSQSEAYSDPVVEGIRRILEGAPGRRSLNSKYISSVRVGTTLATNALLERKGTPVALFITRGFQDLLEIGNQARPEIFSLAIRKPEILYQRVIPVRERINARGEVEIPLDEEATRQALEKVLVEGFTSLAIVLLHAWKNPHHEQLLARWAREIGFPNLSVSHQVMPMIHVGGRGQTTLVDAYLAPVLHRYVSQLQRLLPGIHIEFMRSSGGLIPADNLRAKDTILSGPAGGVLGYATLAQRKGIEEAVGFDMGGTSTDVSRFGGELARVFETTVGGVQYLTDQLDVETVAAGGGSILKFKDQRFQVGPESAGADPGPACYGRGGPLTLTDANLVLGRLAPELLPSTFGPDYRQSLNVDLARRAFEKLTAQINATLGGKLTVYEVAEGFLEVANQVMCRAIRRVSVARGYDLRQHTLVCFGGAAPQHACAIARLLDMQQVVIHPYAGVLSAYGIAMAERSERLSRPVMRPFDPAVYKEIPKILLSLRRQLRGCFQHLAGRRLRYSIYLDLRPQGSDTFLTIPVGTPARLLAYEEILARFKQRYHRHFGFIPRKATLELVNIRLEGLLPGRLTVKEKSPWSTKRMPGEETVTYRKVFFSGKTYQAPVFFPDNLSPGRTITGPALIPQPHSMVVVEPDYRARVDSEGALRLESRYRRKLSITPRRDPVLLEVFNHLFMSIAEQMGYTLVHTAHSVNMKERLDFSCAIFDREGNLIANAPHIPVHLGAMGASVKYLLAQNRATMQPGEVYMTNNPHHGGSHLPDITVVSPIFNGSKEPLFFVANRGHHTDIGGITPGSMPPFATRLEEEGVIIDNFLLVSKGRLREKALHRLLTGGPYPARNLPERLSDLQAQVAANRKGERELKRLVRRYSEAVVLAYMQHICDNAEAAMERALKDFLQGKEHFDSSFTDHLDDGSKICVRVCIDDNKTPRITFDFSGTSGELKGNLNAPPAVTRAAVLYVLRTLIDEDIPLNDGCLRPVTIRIPPGSLLCPSPQAAVVGGNVETSQRVVDVLLGALGLAGASQGTMNNVLFGRPDGKGAQYYETIAGGSGAVRGCAGASAVQVHMTNTRITDPEVLEYRFPEIRLERFVIRRGTGGAGKWPGGDGVERIILFLQPTEVTILSERRRFAPYGMAGGQPGAKGENRLIQKDGRILNLGDKVTRVLQAGERLVIRTPGGGGFCSPEVEKSEG